MKLANSLPTLSAGLLPSFLLGCLAFVMSGCATMVKGSLQSNSARLEDSTRELYSEVRAQAREESGNQVIARMRTQEVTPVTRAAEALIISSRDFNRAVTRRATNEQVQSEFNRVTRDYQQLTETLDQQRSGAANGVDSQTKVESLSEKFERVQQAYRAVENSMSPRQAETERISMSPAQSNAYNEIERRSRLKDFWFP